jgi:NADPH:quinone reductase-like Zn-dependent oxidoreductase
MPNAVVMTGYGPPEVRPADPGGSSPSDPAAADFGVTLSQPTPGRAPDALDETIALLADGRLRLRAHQSVPMQQAAEAHRQLESGTIHERIILTLP